jgi:SulP family sulfate permease
VSDRRRAQSLSASIVAGVLVGFVATIVAVAFAALVFQGLLAGYVARGVGLYLAAAALGLAVLAWRAGERGVIGSPQAVPAAALAIVATGTALGAYGGPDRAFLTVVAATLVATVLTGLTALLIGARRWANLLRYVPYPVVGGFLAGIGWLLLRGGVAVSAGAPASLGTLGDLITGDQLQRWVPALAFGALLVVLTRATRNPLVVPIAIGAGLVAFALGMLATGSTLDAARDGRWLLGPFPPGYLWQPWPLRAVTGADWIAVLKQAPAIVTAVFLAVLAILVEVGATELTVERYLDPNRELRDAAIANVAVGVAGGTPGFHAAGLSSLVRRMRADARVAGVVAALVPLLVVLVGVDALELVPKMLVGGVLVFAGLGLIVEWLWDRRATLTTSDRVVVVLILLAIAWLGPLSGVVVGLVLALALFAVDYGRVELLHQVAFGDALRSTVDRSPDERAVLRAHAGSVEILRVRGFVFFGTASGLLDRARRRVETGDLRYLVVDLTRVSGVDASAVVAMRKAAEIARADGFELVFTGATEPVQERLTRGGVIEEAGVVAFDPDLDHGLERCEDGLLAGSQAAPDDTTALAGGRQSGVAGEEPGPSGGPRGGEPGPSGGMPVGLAAYAERVTLAPGAVLLHQGEAAGDVFLLASGRLRIETATPEGTRMRLRVVRPGAVVGEVALYTGAGRTADVVAETPSEVLRLSRAAIDRLDADDPELAAALHRWLATTVSERLTFTQRAVEALMD